MIASLCDVSGGTAMQVASYARIAPEITKLCFKNKN